jgi:chemotaxis protein MotB
MSVTSASTRSSFVTAARRLPLAAPLLLAACVSQTKYDELQAQNQQLQQQVSGLNAQVNADQAQITRLQGAIRFTVNSDLLFPSGGYQMSEQGKQIIAKFASRLAATQQNKIVVNGYTDDAPVGRELARQGITSNQILSQKRAEDVMQFLISQGVRPDLVAAKGYGDTDPVAPNNTREGRAQNRRVELTLATPGS